MMIFCLGPHFRTGLHLMRKYHLFIEEKSSYADAKQFTSVAQDYGNIGSRSQVY